jgi:4-amino-4-deoxy-L-arabinose transferase-like glycosyltransferase
MFTQLLDKNYPHHLKILVAAGLFFFVPFLWSVHLFDWDEINFAESAREMIASGNYTQVQVNFKPFWEKPPLFFWLQVLSMKVFGINEFAARFPNAIFGVLTLVVFYLIGKKLYDGRFGFLWALSYLGSLLPHLYFKSAIIDPIFNFFIFLSIFFIYQTVQSYQTKTNKRSALLAGIFAGLAILTKGPVGFLLISLTFLVYWISARFKRIVDLKSLFIFTFAMVVVSSAWYGLEVIKNGWWFFESFIKYQIRLLVTADAGHKQPLYYHFIVVFIGCFPMSAFAIKSIIYKDRSNNEDQANFRKIMLYLFWVVMILFTIVKTKIVHYSSMSYFPLSFLSAHTIYYFLERKEKPQKYVFAILWIFGLTFSIALISVPIFAYFKTTFYPYIKDPFALMSLQTNVTWGGWEFLIGVIYLAMTIIGIVKLKGQQLAHGILSLFFAAAFCLWGYLAIVIPKIESYSQRPAIEFYQELKGQPVYVTTKNLKSYAHYFYFQMPKYSNPSVYDSTGGLDNEWLLNGKIDKPVYVVVKANKVNETLETFPELKYVKTNGGFALLKRDKR